MSVGLFFVAGRLAPAKIKKDRIDQHSPRCPDRFGPSVLSKLVYTLAIEVP